MIIVIDNYDSFTYNLVQYLGELGEELAVFRNDAISTDEMEEMNPERIIISPGPGRPEDAGISKSVIRRFAERVPILGVCLGHQAIAEVYGAKVVGADSIMHGKVSSIYHKGEGIFSGIPSPFIATRYHSLLADPATVKDPLEITAWTEEKEVMGLRHMDYPVWGVQFHPESIMTAEGKKLLKNFVSL